MACTVAEGPSRIKAKVKAEKAAQTLGVDIQVKSLSTCLSCLFQSLASIPFSIQHVAGPNSGISIDSEGKANRKAKRRLDEVQLRVLSSELLTLLIWQAASRLECDLYLQFRDYDDVLRVYAAFHNKVLQHVRASCQSGCCDSQLFTSQRVTGFRVRLQLKVDTKKLMSDAAIKQRQKERIVKARDRCVRLLECSSACV